MNGDPFRCICDPADIFDPPDPQQYDLRLRSSESRICGHEQEPDGERCVGWLRFEPDDVQAKCTACGGWEGRFAPPYQTSAQPNIKETA